MVKGKWLNLNMQDKPLLRIALTLLPSCKIILVKIFFLIMNVAFWQSLQKNVMKNNRWGTLISL